MMITWNTDVEAPGCPGEILADDGRSILIQRDWDYPGTAASFGFSLRESIQRCNHCGSIHGDRDGEEEPRCQDCHERFAVCDHSHTDGTVNCPDCGITVGEFIAAAYDWLRDNDGATAEDPGYFEE